MESKIKSIFEYLKDKFNNLEQKDKYILTGAGSIFIVSKILSLFKLNIPGLSVMPYALLFSFIGFNIVKNSKENDSNGIKSKLYFLLGSILSGLSLLTFSCMAIVYVFIILGMIML